VPRLLERTLNLKIDEAYPKLKVAFEDKGCKVISEEPPNRVSFKQGSLWGIAPQTAKKTITAALEPAEGGTRIKFSSKLASDWKNITLIGCVFAAALAGVCAWIAADLTDFLASRVPSFWSELVTVEGIANLTAAHTLINLTWGLTFFLSVIILLEAAVVLYAHYKIDLFTKETLTRLN
jgi:hypothetical protein